MSSAGARGRVGRAAVVLGVTLLLLLVSTGVGVERGARAVSYPPLAQPGRAFLSNLSVPSVVPGGSTSVAFEVSDPENVSIDGTTITFAVYAFNGFPGDATSALPVAHAPVLSNATSSGEVVNVSLGSVASGSSRYGTIALATSSDTPTGTFAIRTALSFHVASQAYRLESRGWFSASVWQNATVEPNGSGTVNLTALNVSGIVPETAVLVRSSSWPIVLGVLLAVGLGLVGVGAWVYFRRGAASNSGVG